ncbi:hypothetical protein D9M70_524950 [compost metagenome]
MADNVVVERGVGAKRCDDRYTRLDHTADDLAEQPVDAFTDRDIGRRGAEVGRKCLLQVVVFRVGVFPGSAGCFPDRREHAFGGAEAAFVGSDSRGDRATPLAFDGLRPDKRNC